MCPGNGVPVIPQYRPESYRLHFKVDGKEVSPAVKKKFFDDVKVGDRIEVGCGLGRLSGSHQMTQIRLIEK